MQILAGVCRLVLIFVGKGELLHISAGEGGDVQISAGDDRFLWGNVG